MKVLRCKVQGFFSCVGIGILLYRSYRNRSCIQQIHAIQSWINDSANVSSDKKALQII